MAKIKINLYQTLISLLFFLMIMGCAEQNVSPKKDLTLPNFSFIGLSEPMADRSNIRLSVHIKIPYSELKFTRYQQKYMAQYEIGISLADNKGERISGKIWKDSLIVSSYAETRMDTKFVNSVRVFQVPADELTLTVRVTDMFTRKTRVLSDVVDQSKIYEQDLALGNIVILDGDSSPGNQVLMEQVFYEIMDTLKFQVRLIGQNGPYSIHYELMHKNELKNQFNDLIDRSGPIDTLLYYEVVLNNMLFSTYTLHFEVRDEKSNVVKTRAHFRVRIQGIHFDVGDLQEAINQLQYIASDKQIRAMLSGDEEEQLKMFNEFWDLRDPSPGTTVNELMEEYYRRIAFSIEAFTVVHEGWKSDRGMIYVLFGPPDEIQRSPFELDRKPYEVWLYYHLGREFIFIDDTGFGDFKLDRQYYDQNDWRFRY